MMPTKAPGPTEPSGRPGPVRPRLRRAFAASVVAFAALAALAPGAARAEPSEADRATARLLAEEGRGALARKDFALAADRFGRAEAMVHAPTLLLDLGRARAGLGQLISAQEAYSRIVREGVAPAAPPAFARAFASAREELDALTLRIPSVTIVIKGALSPTVTLDGVPLPAASLGVKRAVDPGSHVIRAQAAGLAPAEARFTVAEGSGEAVTLELQQAIVVVQAGPPARPPPALAPRPAAAPPPPAAPPAGSLQRTVGVAALGVGGAGLVLGAITGGLFLAQRSSLVSGCVAGTCPPAAHDAIQNYQAYGALSTTGFVVAGVGAVTGAVLLLTAPKSRSTEHATSVGPGTDRLRGAF